MTAFTEWTPEDAARLIRPPRENDDKYSRGVLGVITGSEMYPGAAVLGVDAALHTGVGMVRYVGPRRAEDLVLARRPESVVTNGRVQAWLIGSGTDYRDYADDSAMDAMRQGVPVILDGGALHLHEKRVGPLVLTPHFRELARIFDADVEHIADDPGSFALMASRELSATVVLKGHSTYIAGPGSLLVARSAPTWLATAGAGDSLAGILGALIATNAFAISHDERLMPKLAATACVLHGLAAHRASGGGPLTILGLNEALPATIAELRLA
jgi:ADP-dependent NAD(P)H-hydrate dehydratase / NAD(P)H-hydrate epimerase